jgi:hypothetical protein
MSYEGSTDDRIKLVAQEALDTTVMAFHQGGETDVEGRLRTEMKRHGLEIEDEAWVVELAAKIRRGERVVIAGGPEDTEGDQG